LLFLGKSDVDRLLDVDALIDALAAAMTDLSEGRASVPPRTFAMVADRGLLAAMPAYLGTNDVLAAKLVLVFPGNASKGLETHQAIVGVFDAQTGVPVAVMDGASITATRTAAGSALATRTLARADAKVLAIVGTGVQARSHARAVTRVCDFDEVIVAGRTPDKVAALADEVGAKAASSVEEAVGAADVVCTCTHATQAVVLREWLKSGTHVNAVGFTSGPELDPAIFDGAVVAVESRDAAIGEHPNGAVDLTTAIEQNLLGIDDVREIGEILSGTRPGRTNDEEITVYRSVGVAVQDAAAAQLVFDEAVRRGAGTDVEL
jgi:ornithine cyclodeaminase